jgi:inosose dehydratase
MDRIAELARIAKGDYGVESTLHAHTGSYIEYEDELDRAMNDLPEALVGLCIDTGHAAYAAPIRSR